MEKIRIKIMKKTGHAVIRSESGEPIADIFFDGIAERGEHWSLLKLDRIGQTEVMRTEAFIHKGDWEVEFDE